MTTLIISRWLRTACWWRFLLAERSASLRLRFVARSARFCFTASTASTAAATHGGRAGSREAPELRRRFRPPPLLLDAAAAAAIGYSSEIAVVIVLHTPVSSSAPPGGCAARAAVHAASRLPEHCCVCAAIRSRANCSRSARTSPHAASAQLRTHHTPHSSRSYRHTAQRARIICTVREAVQPIRQGLRRNSCCRRTRPGPLPVEQSTANHTESCQRAAPCTAARVAVYRLGRTITRTAAAKRRFGGASVRRRCCSASSCPAVHSTVPVCPTTTRIGCTRWARQ